MNDQNSGSDSILPGTELAHRSRSRLPLSTSYSPGRLEKRLRSGHFAVVTEIKPPDSADLTSFIEAVSDLRPYVDTVELTDMPLATPHIENLAPGALLVQAGFDVMLNLTCRDRNVIAQQGYLLAAASLGIHNILCVTGDSPAYGDHPNAHVVNELDVFGLLKLARRMRDEHIYESGRMLLSPPRLFLGAAAAQDAEPVSCRAERTACKVEAGANFIETQPVFDVDSFTQYMSRLRNLGITQQAFVIAGVLAVPSLSMAEYLRQVPGIRVPAALSDRLRRVPESQRETEGLNYACEVIDQLREIQGVGGVLIYPLDLPRERTMRLIEMAGIQPE
jgi:methylenetetrahydrofolate reductase (NADPH)